MLMPDAPQEEAEAEAAGDPAEPDELEDEDDLPPTQLGEDRLGDLAVLVEATYERMIDPFYQAPALRNAAEQICFALGLAQRLTGYAAGILGDDYGLDEQAQFVFEAMQSRIAHGMLNGGDEAERAPPVAIGFGPWEPSSTG